MESRVVEALREALAADAGVAAGYLFEADPVDRARQLVIGLDLDLADPTGAGGVVRRMRATLSDLAPARTVVSWTVVRRQAKLAELRARVAPLFERLALALDRAAPRRLASSPIRESEPATRSTQPPDAALEINVIPAGLTAAGAELLSAGTGVAGALGNAGASVPAACGFPGTAGAFEAMWVTWRRALVQTGTNVGASGSAVGAVAAAYEFVDSISMPGR